MNKEQYFQALELDAKRLSLEAFGQDAVNNLIYKYIPQTFENFLGYVNSFWLITKHKAIPDIYKSQERREFSKLVLSQPYTVLANMDVIVPEGLIISGSDYSVLLKEAMTHIGITRNNVNLLDSYIKMLMGTLKGKLSTDVAIPRFAEVALKRDSLNSQFSKAFGKHTNVKMKWSEWVKRNNDWDGIFTITDALVKDYENLKLNTLVDDVNQLKSNMDNLIDMIKNHKLDGSSEVVPKELAVATREVALELEMLTAVVHRCLAFTNAMKVNVETYNQMFSIKK